MESTANEQTQNCVSIAFAIPTLMLPAVLVFLFKIGPIANVHTIILSLDLFHVLRCANVLLNVIQSAYMCHTRILGRWQFQRNNARNTTRPTGICDNERNAEDQNVFEFIFVKVCTKSEMKIMNELGVFPFSIRKLSACW